MNGKYVHDLMRLFVAVVSVICQLRKSINSVYELEDVTNFVCQFVIINQLIMDFENDAVCEKIINEIDLVFQNDSDLYDIYCVCFYCINLYFLFQMYL